MLTLVAISAPARASLVAHWPLDGDLRDASGSGNHGTFSGGRRPTFAAGHDNRADGAVQLDGVDDRIDIDEIGRLPAYSNPRYTVAFWVKGTNDPGRYIFSETSSRGNRPLFALTADRTGRTRKLAVWIRDDSGATLVDLRPSTADVLDNAWHHVAWTDDHGRGKLWIDGTLDATDFTYAPGRTTLDTTTLGAWFLDPRACCSFPGRLDDVRVYDHVLSQSEIEALVSPGGGCTPADLVTATPDVISTVGGDKFAVTGTGFTSRHVVRIGGQPLVGQGVVVGPLLSTVRGTTPPLAAGVHDVDILCESGKVVDVLASAVEARDPCAPGSVRLTDVVPGLVSTLGGTPVEIRGSGFFPGQIATAGGQPLDNQQLVAAGGVTFGAIRGRVPALAPGLHDISILCPTGAAIATLPASVEAAPPPGLTRVEPDRIYFAGGTPVTVFGSHLRDSTLVSFGATPLTNPHVSEDGLRITALAPPFAGEGPLDVTAEDSRGTAVLAGGVTYVGCQTLVVDSVDPVLVSSLGGTTIEIHGSGFELSYTARMGNVALTGVQTVSPTLIRATVPAIPPGFYDVLILCADGQTAGASPPIEVAPPPVLTRVEPGEIPANGGVAVSVFGRSLRPGTIVRIGDRVLENTVAKADATSITGTAPAWSVGMPFGTPPIGEPARDTVSAENALGIATLADAIRWTPMDRPPGPQQIETSLAEGTVRLRWVNPRPYATIVLLGENGETLDELPGTVTSYSLPVDPQIDRIRLSIKGITDHGIPSNEEDASAERDDCDRPPPLDAYVSNRFSGLEFEDVEFSLYGGHVEADVTRCVESGQGGGAAAIPAPHNPEPLGHGVGYTRPIGTGPSEAVTGFTLNEPARKLEIAAYYRQLATDLGVEIRGHLIHVYPDDGFEDEFTFPQGVVGTQNRWSFVTYFRADNDVGHMSENPAPCPADGECAAVEIPSGDYRLELYAVGGDFQVPYYALASDPTDQEILVAGTSCPPYPMVRVRDVSDVDTLPFISEIRDTTLTSPSQQALCNQNTLRVRLEAEGYWLDTCNQQHPLESYNSSFEYSWKVYDTEEGTSFTESHRSWIDLCLVCGCYDVEVTVRWTGCPVTRTFRREIVVDPPGVPCRPEYKYSFFYPQPNPGGMVGIVGLNTPPASQNGSCSERPLAFSVLVSPNCECPDNSGCAAAKWNEVEFDLGIAAILYGSQGVKIEVTPIGADFTVEPSCPSTNAGQVYFHISLDDLGAVPPHEMLDSFYPRLVFLIGRAKNSNEKWQTIGNSMKLYNPPNCLTDGFWSGSFAWPSRYAFRLKSSPESEQGFNMGSSADVPIDLPPVGDLDGRSFSVDGTDGNGVSTGFTSSFALDGGTWSGEDGVGGTRGAMLDNEVGGAPLSVPPSSGAAQNIVMEGGGAGLDPPSYEWCDSGNIFNYEIKEDIFNGLIYAGTIGPVPVNVWAEIGFGFRMNIDYQVTFYLHPFALMENENPNMVDAYFYVFMDMGISIPASVRADILSGVASIALTLEPGVIFTTTPWLEFHDQAPNPAQAHLDLRANFTLDMYMEACIFWETLCVETPKLRLITTEIFPGLHDCPSPVYDCGGNRTRDCVNGGVSDGGGGGGGSDGGGADLLLASADERLSMPATMVSPDGETYVDVWVRADAEDGRLLNIRVTRGGLVTNHQFLFDSDLNLAYITDPAGAFVSNDTALVAVTMADAFQFEPVPASTFDDHYLPAANRNAARANIYLYPLDPGAPKNISAVAVPISETSADIADWRADGMASVAASQDTGEAWVAWVRYRTEFLEDRGTKDVAVPCPPPADCNALCPAACQGVGVDPRFHVKTVRDLQPRVDQTSIFVRKMTFSPQDGVTAVNDMAPLEIAGTGINIEPSVAVTRAGDVACCAWVHDGFHQNLMDDNRGRPLECSFYTLATDAWTASTPVVRPEILADYPGILEPLVRLARKSDGHLDGIVGFTAVPEDSAPENTGLGGLRYLYTCRLVDHQDGTYGFEDPVRIRGRCDRLVYALEYDIVQPVPEIPDPNDVLSQHGPDWVTVFNERGRPGTERSSGLLSAMVLSQGAQEWTAPVRLDDGESQVMNVVAASGRDGSLHSTFLQNGPARRDVRLGMGGGGGGGGGGAADVVDIGYQTVSTRLDPDLALASCRLGHAMAGPGARVPATVRVDNRGFSSSPFRGEESVTGVEIVYVEDDGSERVVDTAPLPVLEPGESHTLEFTIEMPHEPVLLVARVRPNPTDRDRSNDSRECFFGAPKPANIHCDVRDIRDEEGSFVARLEWEDLVAYEKVSVYRDEVLLTTIPGDRHRFVDVHVEPGCHTYALRGTLGASTSSRASCEVCVPPPQASGFKRGDFNGSNKVDLSDAISLLSYLFLGGAPSACPDAGDTDDSGRLDISDAIGILGYLFLGQRPPAAPGPTNCGIDPTDDGIERCTTGC